MGLHSTINIFLTRFLAPKLQQLHVSALLLQCVSCADPLGDLSVHSVKGFSSPNQEIDLNI